jgi:hypothetical protein
MARTELERRRGAMTGAAGMARNGSEGKGEESSGSVSQARLAELRQIERDGGGIIMPEAVVAFATNPNTALHSAFEWDDTEAARKYRLQQARQLIRVIVEVSPHNTEPIRAFVALRSDRYEDGGYRHMPTLLKSRDGRKSILETALWELEAFQEKYKELKELAEVFSAIRNIKKAVKSA